VTARNGDSDDMQGNEPPSLAEKAYDKTSYLVQSVKGLLVSGISKIKSYIGGKEDTKGGGSSRRSRSRVKIGRRVSEEEESSYERYKTPVGRSKSRTVPMNPVTPTSDEEINSQDDDEQEDRKRHVNFNIKRVVTTTDA
jgi:hypothetical protein